MAIVALVAAPCAAGKTHAACHFIAANINAPTCLESFLYVAPSKLLLEQVRVELARLGIEATVITSDTHPGKVVNAVLTHMQRFTQGGQVLLITHNAYFGLPYFPSHGGWRPVIDEVPQLDRFYQFTEPNDLTLLKAHLQVDRFINSKIVQLRPTSSSRLRGFLDRADDTTSPIAKLLRDALSPNKEIFADLESWHSSPADIKAVNLISVLNERAFANAVLMGAHIENSLVGTMLSSKGMRLQPHAPITRQLRYQSYPAKLAARLTIQYVLEGRAWSKTLRDRPGKSARKIMEEVEEIVLPELHNAPYLLAANKDYCGSLAQQPGCVRLPVIAHGLNTYADHTNLVFLAALNRPPAHHRLLRYLGYSDEVIRRSTGHEVLLQALMRTNLRVPSSDAKVRVIVPDRQSADFLADIFKGSAVCKLGDLDYQRLPPLSSKERKDRHKLKKVRAQGGRPGEHFSKESLKRNRSFSRTPAGGNPLIMTIAGTVYAKYEHEFHQWTVSVLELAGHLRLAARTPCDGKDDALLFCLTEFDPTIDRQGVRRQVNIVALYGLILDFDGGNLSPEEFERIFWPKDKKQPRFAFVICNSYSRRPDDPNRFRVIIPFRTPTTSLKLFQALYEMIVDGLEEHGFSREDSKLDPACRSGNQLFRFPGKNRHYPEWAFCRQYGLTRMRDFQRHALDPASYIIVSEPIEEQPKPAPAKNGNSQQWHSDPTVAELQRQIRDMDEDRHRPFFIMGVKLRSMGYSLDDIQEILNDTADNDEKMLKKAAEIVASLRAYELQDAYA